VFFLLCVAGFCWEGQIVPKNAIPVLAPKNVIRVTGSMSSSSGIQIEDRLENATLVQKGDEILKYRQRGNNWDSLLENRIRQKIAERDGELKKLEQEIQSQNSAVSRLELTFARLKLKQDAKEVLPVRDQEILVLDIRLAEIEFALAELTLKARQEKLKQRQNFYAVQLRYMEEEKTYLRYQLSRYSQKASVLGKVYFPPVKNYNRPVKKDDYIDSGVVVAQLAPEDELQVRFAVPEQNLNQIPLDTVVKIRRKDGDEVFMGKIVKQNLFPIKSMEWYADESRPDAEEMLFEIFAEFIGVVPEFPEGAVLQVSL